MLQSHLINSEVSILSIQIPTWVHPPLHPPTPPHPHYASLLCRLLLLLLQLMQIPHGGQALAARPLLRAAGR